MGLTFPFYCLSRKLRAFICLSLEESRCDVPNMSITNTRLREIKYVD
jgi:hypothetical protein